MMLKTPPLVSGQGPKSGRKALQPKNINSPAPITPINYIKPKPKPKPDQIILASPIHDNNNNNKENIRPDCVKVTECLQEDGSLADELSAIREKLERLRVDKEKTEKMLKERAVMLDLKIKEIIQRGDVQKQLEIEVDRLYRLNQIRLSCLRISPIRTLRDKEQQKKDQFKANITTQETSAYDDDDDQHTSTAQRSEM